MIEREAKFLVEDAGDIARGLKSLGLDQWKLQALGVVVVNDRYHDTPDWQIFRAGWAYRWRVASRKRSMTLKSVGLNEGPVQVREEVEQMVAKFPSNAGRLPDGDLEQRLAFVDRSALRELFHIRNRRRLFHLRNDRGTLIELAIDHAEIRARVPAGKDAPGRMKFKELELELKEGSEKSFREAVEMVQQRFGLLPARLSKFERGLQTVGLSPPARLGREPRSLEESGSLRALREQRLRRSHPAVALAYRSLLEQFEEMLAQEPRAWEGLDLEGVHQMRVATRRARAVLRAFRAVLPDSETKKLSSELKWLAAVLGEVRDLDVYQVNLEEYATRIMGADAACLIEYKRHLAESWRKRREDLLACLTAQRYRQLKTDFSEFLARDSSRTGTKDAGAQSISDAAAKLVSRRYKRVLRDGRAITPESPDEALHALRLDCKRLRYLFEFFEPIYRKTLRPFVKRLKRLQDELGDFNDACVATERLRRYAESLPPEADHQGQLIALGQLIHAQELQAGHKRAHFQETWKRFDREGERKQLLRLLG